MLAGRSSPRNAGRGMTGLAALTVVALLSASPMAGVPQAPETRLEAIMRSIAAGGLQNEIEAFDRLEAFRVSEGARRADLGSRVNLGFIKLLGWVNAYYRQDQALPSQPPSDRGKGEEGDSALGEFLGNAIGAVAGLHDPRGIPALLDDIETGNMATEALAAFGDRVVPALMERLTAGSPGTVVCTVAAADLCVKGMHSGALRALTQMAAPATYATLSSSNRARIRQLIVDVIRRGSPMDRVTALQGAGLLGDTSLEPLILRAARSGANASVRMYAVITLGDLRDQGLRSALQQIAAMDPDANVREAAQIALGKLGGH